jgi:hypothetical protein
MIHSKDNLLFGRRFKAREGTQIFVNTDAGKYVLM